MCLKISGSGWNRVELFLEARLEGAMGDCLMHFGLVLKGGGGWAVQGEGGCWDSVTFRLPQRIAWQPFACCLLGGGACRLGQAKGQCPIGKQSQRGQGGTHSYPGFPYLEGSQWACNGLSFLS